MTANETQTAVLLFNPLTPLISCCNVVEIRGKTDAELFGHSLKLYNNIFFRFSHFFVLVTCKAASSSSHVAQESCVSL